MSIVDTWIVGWVLPLFPVATATGRKSVVEETKEVTITALLGLNASISFFSKSTGLQVSGNVMFVSAAKEEIYGTLEATDATGVKNGNFYHVTAKVFGAGAGRTISGFISYDVGSQDSGGQWGGPPR
jgi:hypothetical protein